MYGRNPFSFSGVLSYLNMSCREFVCASLSLSTITIGSALSGTGSSVIGARLAGFGMSENISLIFATVRSTSMSPTTMMAWFDGWYHFS